MLRPDDACVLHCLHVCLSTCYRLTAEPYTEPYEPYGLRTRAQDVDGRGESSASLRLVKLIKYLLQDYELLGSLEQRLTLSRVDCRASVHPCHRPQDPDNDL